VTQQEKEMSKKLLPLWRILSDLLVKVKKYVSHIHPSTNSLTHSLIAHSLVPTLDRRLVMDNIRKDRYDFFGAAVSKEDAPNYYGMK
jgi:hypothetical protein